jgi:hypothetical protein
VEPNGDEDAFWMEETQIEGNSTNNVTDFIAHITPHFSAILQQFNLVFISIVRNIDGYLYLDKSNTNLKPN